MAQPTPRSRKYCSVHGCLNSTLIKPELSFFTLPKDALRRTQWLHLISREDLTYKAGTAQTVCEEHFSENDILGGTQRKKLKMFASPSLNLPTLQKREKSTQTQGLMNLRNKQVQTERVHASENTANNHNTPRKHKEILECSKKVKIKLSVKRQKQIFRKFCDKFLTKELAELAKAQTYVKEEVQYVKEEVQSSSPACESPMMDEALSQSP